MTGRNIGGRGTLVGAILGAVLVNLANTYFNNEAKEAWPLILGSLFIVVTVFMPEGIVGIVKKSTAWLARQSARWIGSREVEKQVVTG